MTALATHLWQSTLFATMAALLTLAFRRNRAQVRYWLWLGASLKFLVPFSILTSLGGGLATTPVARKLASPSVSVAVEQFAEPFAFVPAAQGTIDKLPLVLFAGWACGFLALTLIRLRDGRRIRAALRASEPLEIPAAVEIRVSAGLLEPGVIGLMRPVILLPEGIAEQLTPPQLEAVLAHELCHVRRRDNLFASIHMIVETMFWFHPLVWWIGARLMDERERACDEAVLTLGSEPRIYADAILNVCRLYVESPLACIAGVTGAGIKQRIEAIMTNRTGLDLNRAKKFLLACAAVVALAGPVAIGVVAHAQTPPAQNHRTVAILFDFTAMTPDDQSHARQLAIDHIRNATDPADTVAVMVANNGRVTVAQDFTDNRTVLESVISSFSADPASGSADAKLASIESAANLLANLSGKKSLTYISTGLAGPDRQAELQHAIATLFNANVALYPINVRGPIAQYNLRSAPAVSPDEQNRRVAYAGANFRSGEMYRVYVRYGPPDTIDDQIWRYNYLENFHSSVEFEFTQKKGPLSVHINWPPPLGKYGGVPVVTASSAGLPGNHAEFLTYPAGELQILSVPLEGLSGRLNIEGQIKMRDTADQKGMAFVRDVLQAEAGTYRTSFTIPAGNYVCRLTVTEIASGRTFEETIPFEVK